MKSVATRRERTLEMAQAFLEEVRREIERALPAGMDLPPRVRSVHERVGHATPEYRTLAVPVPAGAAGASPEVLSGIIARYAASKSPICLLFALDAETRDDTGARRSVLIAEARDESGTRLFFVQPFEMVAGRVRWGEPEEGGWRDPGSEEMILDASFAR